MDSNCGYLVLEVITLSIGPQPVALTFLYVIGFDKKLLQFIKLKIISKRLAKIDHSKCTRITLGIKILKLSNVYNI